MRILISGAGIAGPTRACWLLHHRFEPTLVEEAPHLLCGSGFEVAVAEAPEMVSTRPPSGPNGAVASSPRGTPTCLPSVARRNAPSGKPPIRRRARRRS